MNGQDVTEQASPPRAFDAMPPALQAQDLRKSFGGVQAVDGVSLTLAPGEILALVGPSGCGKSTLIRLLTGLLAPADGVVAHGGTVVFGPGVNLPPEERRIGVVFQQDNLFPHLTVAENVAFGLTHLKSRERRARVAEVMQLVDLPDHGERYPHELSGGERQRIGLARALAPEPDVVLFDEPFANLDPNLRLKIRTETVRILRRAQASALLVTHDQVEAMAVGDRVAVMLDGRIVQVGSPEDVFNHPADRFVATFLGEADFLPATWHDDHLMTEVGPCPLPGKRSEGEVMVRPHEVTLAASDQPNATVEAAEFQGAHVLYELRLASGRPLHALLDHSSRFTIGDQVLATATHGHAPALL